MGWLTMRDTGRFATGRAYLDDQFTYNWRARCHANLAKRRLLDAKPTPRPGQTIVFDKPLRFNDGIERTRFEVIVGPKGRGLRFRDPSSRQVCQIPSIKKRTYRLINPAVAVPQVAS